MSVQPVVIIAAAGRARRFSGEQKVVAEVGGRPAICRVAEVCEEALGPHLQVVVVGHQAAQVRAALGDARDRSYVVQEPQLGTGHALATALAQLPTVPGRLVFFLCGDKPLLSTRSLTRIREEREASGAAMVFLTGGLSGDLRQSRQGRVLEAHVGTPHAEVLAVVERSTVDALGDGETVRHQSLTGSWHEYTREQLLEIQAVNLSAYVWPEEVLRAHVESLPLHPEKGEYYITDLVAILREHRLRVGAVRASVDGEGVGIDTPEQLVTARRVWRELQSAP